MKQAISVRAAAALLLATTGCSFQDNRAPTETEQTPPVEQAPSAAAPSASTLCAAYEERLAEHRTALAASPQDGTLQERVTTFEALIDDACN